MSRGAWRAAAWTAHAQRPSHAQPRTRSNRRVTQTATESRRPANSDQPQSHADRDELTQTRELEPTAESRRQRRNHAHRRLRSKGRITRPRQLQRRPLSRRVLATPPERIRRIRMPLYLAKTLIRRAKSRHQPPTASARQPTRDLPNSARTNRARSATAAPNEKGRREPTHAAPLQLVAGRTTSPDRNAKRPASQPPPSRPADRSTAR